MKKSFITGIMMSGLTLCSLTLAPAQEPAAPVDKHAFGVLPNYRTVEDSTPFTPITAKQKFKIAVGDTFGATAYLIGGVSAGLSQIDNSNPTYGQGAKGFAKRFGAYSADQDIGNFMTEAILPVAFREDPRYFRSGKGPMAKRLVYAAARVLITRTDSNHSRFNTSECLGNGVVAALGNLYYVNDRGFSPTMQRMGRQISTDALSNVLKEIWPDVKRKYFSRKDQRH